MKPAGVVRMLTAGPLPWECVEDGRCTRGRRYGLPGLLKLVVLGLAAGARTGRQLEMVGRDVGPRGRKALGLGPGAPSDTCLYRLLRGFGDWRALQRVNGALLQRALGQGGGAGGRRRAPRSSLRERGAMSVDGKGAGGGMGEAPDAVCRSTTCDAAGTPCWHVYALRAALVSHPAVPVLDQEAIEAKRWEPSVFPQLLARTLAAHPHLFRYVLADAGMTSAANAACVLAHGKVYVLGLKENQRRLHAVAQGALLGAATQASTREVARGGIEVREVRRARVPPGESFPGAQQFWAVRRTLLKGGEVAEVEERLFVTSAAWEELTAEETLQLVRMHWGIENGANWTADMHFGEDAGGPCMQGLGALALLWLRLIAYNALALVRADTPHHDGRVSWKRTTQLLERALLRLGSATGAPHSGRARPKAGGRPGALA